MSNIGETLNGLDGLWKRAAACNLSTCVEVRSLSNLVQVRDSKQRDGAAVQEMISVSEAEWVSFLIAIKESAGLVGTSAIDISLLDDGWVAISNLSGTTTLSYDTQEWEIFVAGVYAGDFELARASASVAN